MTQQSNPGPVPAARPANENPPEITPDIIDAPLPFPGASGAGIRVAIIDSGVNPRHPHIVSCAGGVGIGNSAADPSANDSPANVVENAGIENAPSPLPYDDFLGHGTAVTAAIQEKAPGAEYYAVKLFDRSLSTSIDLLTEAIEWALDQRMDVINLSLGTRNANHIARMEPLVKRALEQGAILVSARESDGHLCYPGSLPGVLSVGLDWEIDRNRFRIEDSDSASVFYASGYPRSLPNMPRRRNLHGISFAVANMSGMLIRACEVVRAQGAAPTLDAVSATLRAELERLAHEA
jgi:hypothetical protein